MDANFSGVNIVVSEREAKKIHEEIEALQIALDAKVDKVEGKGLSTNDYTTAEKEKLSGIEDGAEVNVQADWDETSSSEDDYISNKPAELTTTEIQDIVDSLS